MDKPSDLVTAKEEWRETRLRLIDARAHKELVRARVLPGSHHAVVAEERLKVAVEEYNRAYGWVAHLLYGSSDQPDIDDVTGIRDRGELNRDLTEAIEDSRATGRPLSVASLDIDDFKAFNREHGSVGGDKVLRMVARTAEEIVTGKGAAYRRGQGTR